MRLLLLRAALCLTLAAHHAASYTCTADIAEYCGGRGAQPAPAAESLVQCLSRHVDALAPGCRKKIMARLDREPGGAPERPPPPPVDGDGPPDLCPDERGATLRRAPRVSFPLCVATTMTEDRAPSLHYLATTWDGEISVAVLVTNYTRARRLGRGILALPDGTRPVDDTRITVTIVEDTGVRCPNRVPVNLLRNAALGACHSEYVLSLDVDFGIFPKVSAMRHIWNAMASLGMRPRSALVLPAFETSVPVRGAAENVTDPAGIGCKMELLRHVATGSAYQFHGRQYLLGHGPTDYERWIQARSIYKVQYRFGYEPYVVVRRSELPQFDTTFVGKGMNKVSWCHEIAAAGFEFWVVPDVFVVHRAHKKQSSTCANPVLRKASSSLPRSLQEDLNSIGWSCWNQFDDRVKTAYGGYTAPGSQLRMDDHPSMRSARALFPHGCVTEHEYPQPLPQTHVWRALASTSA